MPDAPDAPDAPLDSAAAPVVADEPTPSPEVTATTEGEGEGSDGLDASGLPSETIGEIRKLRKENARYRTTASTWDSATTGWDPESVQHLQNALTLGRDDPVAFGRWLIENGKALMGDPTPDAIDDAIADAPATPAAPDTGPLTADAVAKIVASALDERDKRSTEQVERNRRIEQIRSQSEELGFGPSHPLHKALLLTAKEDTGGDLAKAAELLKQGISGVNNLNTDSDSPPEADPANQPGAGHTPLPPEGGAAAGTQRASDPRQAMRERIDKVLGANRSFDRVAEL